MLEFEKVELQDSIASVKRDELIGDDVQVLVDEVGIARSFREAPEIDGIIKVSSHIPTGEFANVKIVEAVGTDIVAIESEKFEQKERKQGQRRILHPGARGDVLDTEGRLLIGNKAQFSAVIHLDALKSEIWKEKVALKKTAFRIREELLNLKDLNLGKLMKHCLKETQLKDRFILLSGKKKKGAIKRVKIYWQNQRITVNENTKNEWSCTISFSNPNGLSSITTENTADLINVNVAGLFSTNFYIHPGNHLLPYKPPASQAVTQNLLTKFLFHINPI